LGVAGKDVLLEHSGRRPSISRSTWTSRCAAWWSPSRRASDYGRGGTPRARLRVATKYMQTGGEHFAAKGVHVRSHQALRLDGASRRCSDSPTRSSTLVATGNTLRANRLHAVEGNPADQRAG